MTATSCHIVKTLEDHHKLIASHSGHGVLISHRARKPLGQRLKEQVTGIVSQGVIHFLEPVEIDENNRDLGFSSLGGLRKLVKPVHQEHSVWQICQRVIVG